ncbi:xanthine dehydrogenase small subunit [Acidovorax delafieldii]|uniref:Xanthine dehydrogenase small subunit n=1 Tax=Acidovorax delafieldii TaxID=47920 RepID=A0AAJ2BR66_ACIDE|nr:xanthine dehydrogenase small subunit [Acidovorax delafieldii]MDR6766386.1 xanthine dehydrogenase small subunit [Acidovorax delafieldii]MDR6836676.1 xanthine dehydrogenase small subunit [Acidovorax delafieldii]MDR7366167.1 xanthine dehydrogenase small subunit [Acidovorax delafieldii]
MTTRPLQFLRRGQPVALGNVPPDRTLLEVLREDLGCTGTKEGCGEGDCGACTVVLGEERDGQLHYSAVNSCIRLAHSVDGMALWTVEDLAEDPLIQPVGDAPAAARQAITLHPAQEAMVQCHGSQCGFCTPGFVMSLFGMYQNHVCHGHPITRELAQEELSGNLCRCTGYRPILDAAQQMASLPGMAVNESEVLQKLKLLRHDALAHAADSAYIAPSTLPELLAARAAHPGAQVVAGCTDVGLWVTKQHKQYAQVLDVTRAAELRQVVQHPDAIHIGAAVTLTDAFAALTAQWPQLHRFATRFAGLPVRNSGTLGGNVANGSPIGDSMPLLIALRAQVVLASQARGERQLPLEHLYTGYRQNVMATDELLVRIVVPRPSAQEQLRAYKISKRFDDDISAVCLVLNLDIADGTVQSASIGAGGVAATPARARQTEAALTGQPWTEATAQRAAAVLQAEFSPISDMRASGAYRRQVLGSLLQRYWLESQGQPSVSLDTLTLEAAV